VAIFARLSDIHEVPESVCTILAMKHLLLFLVFAFLWFNAFPQQVADTLFRPAIAKPAYASNTGPLVLIDEAHYNFHTSTGRFKPFASLLQRDGYRVQGNAQSFSPESLRAAKIVVISNALSERNQTNWSLPTPSAFTDQEIESVRAWVEGGGSLFLIADHMPFPGCNEKLAAAFGFTFYNGFTEKKHGGGPDKFSFQNKRLIKSPLTEGLDPIYSFMGQAFDIPNGAQPILVFDDRFDIKLPDVAWQFNKSTPKIEAAGKAQGAYMSYGKGRLVIFGEAAMFSAQRFGKNRMGFNHPKAKNNAAFLLRLVHWLDGKETKPIP
jgi:hypothetical protein